jgi:hypothetical protein
MLQKRIFRPCPLDSKGGDAKREGVSSSNNF